jgi:hypothetical protein
MQTPSNLTIWLSEQAIPLAAIACFLAFVFAVLAISARNRRIRMNEARSGTNEDTFVDSLIVYGFDPEISRTVYRYLQERQNVHFPIEATDLLDEDLGLDVADLEQTQREVFELTRRLYQPGLRHTPLVTVEDLVRFIQASPRLQTQQAA